MEKPPAAATHEEIPMQPIGSYFELDKEGYVVNPTSIEKIQEEWKPAVDEVIDSYKKEYGDKLSSVYIRGSVAKGGAVKDISDIDSFAYVNLPKEEISHDWTDQAEKEIIQHHPFVQGVELSVDPTADVANDNILLFQSLCVYGKDISEDLPKLKPGKEMVIHLFNIDKRLVWFKSKLETIENDEAEMRRACLWLTKGLLRSGFELTMNRSKKYTRDLYRCYETFAEYYPEKEREMREVLYLALNPTTDKQKLEELMFGLGKWLQEEAKVQYPS